jgi:hopanoid biosynthesis associated protein HpnK
MVAGPAAADAVRRAHANPGLRVGLHLVVIEGHAVLPPADIPDLVDANGWFPSAQFRLGMRYALRPQVRDQLAAEIRAQFTAFAATGLRLDHANAHKHMHLHPVIGRLLVLIGWDFGLRAVRVPAEPPDVMEACGVRVSLGDRALYAWTDRLREQVARAGMQANDHVFGLAWSGHMTRDHLLALARHLPDGVSEIYLHPAARRDAALDALMPDYEHEAELAALLDPEVRAAFQAAAEPIDSIWRRNA